MSSSAGEVPFASRIRDPGFTPGIRDLPKLLELMGSEDDELARDAERAVLRIEERQRKRVLETTMATTTNTTRPARGRLTRLVGRLAAMLEPAARGAAVDANAKTSLDSARDWLVALLGDDDPKTRRAAARAIGNLVPSAGARTKDEGAARIERALLDAWDSAATDDDRRALADALGKVGSNEARAKLAEAATSERPLGKSASRASVMIERAAARENPGIVDISRALSGGLPVRFYTRDGLEVVVAEELGTSWRPEVIRPGVVEAFLEGPLARATAIRTATHVGFPLDPKPRGDDLAETVIAELTSPRAMTILRTFSKTEGAPIRFRLAWAQGGHRRSLTWRCAELVRERSKELINDPSASTWEIVVSERGDEVRLELVPRGFTDDRFVYRTEVVPASSHPTIAAAIARVAPHSPRDVVWDPFVGAGAELVERAYLGPYASLLGTDVDETACAAARTNLQNANVSKATIQRVDSLRFAPPGVTLIVSNPPMGRRVQRGAHGDLLERFVGHAAQVLAPGGALVWAVPEPLRVHARAEQEGLTVERIIPIDMGGFPADLCVYRKGRPGRPAQPDRK